MLRVNRARAQGARAKREYLAQVPKRVDFVVSYVIEFVDRPGRPLMSVERCVCLFALFVLFRLFVCSVCLFVCLFALFNCLVACRCFNSCGAVDFGGLCAQEATVLCVCLFVCILCLRLCVVACALACSNS